MNPISAKSIKKANLTLTRFKRHLKVGSVFTFLVLYGSVFYFLGKSSSLANLIKIKGVTTQKSVESPIESPNPDTDVQSANISASFVKLCANTLYSFSVSYPKDWFTTYNTEAEKCTFFAPYSFVVPQETSSFLIPIKIELAQPQDWPNTVKLHENPNDFQNVISSENLEINGRPAKKITSSSTGNGQISRGLAKVTYLVFDRTRPIVISYQQTEEKEDVQSAKIILTDLVSSITIY